MLEASVQQLAAYHARDSARALWIDYSSTWPGRRRREPACCHWQSLRVVADCAVTLAPAVTQLAHPSYACPCLSSLALRQRLRRPFGATILCAAPTTANARRRSLPLPRTLWSALDAAATAIEIEDPVAMLEFQHRNLQHLWCVRVRTASNASATHARLLVQRVRRRLRTGWLRSASTLGCRLHLVEAV